MYIEEIRIRNFRNFVSEKAILKSGVNVILGENDSGKTNLMNAIRLILDKRLPWYEREIKEEMFPISLPEWRGSASIITLIFNNLNPLNEYEAMFAYETGMSISRGSLSLFVIPNKSTRYILHECKTPSELNEKLKEITIDDYEMIYTVGLSIDYTNDYEYENLLGDFTKGEYKLSPELDTALVGKTVNNIDGIRNNMINFTYIDALRDSVREMNQKSNPLMTLIRKIESNVLEDEKNSVRNKINELNATIASVKEIKNLTFDINNKIGDSIGATYSPNLVLKSEMSPEMKDVFRNLKLKSNIGVDLELNDLGLGSNNIIYIALKLLENMNYENSKFFLLLLEEPEAHLHKHLQMALFEKTGIYPENNVQIVLSTHSVNISSSSKIGQMNIIQKEKNQSIISNPSNGLDEDEIEELERYLDVKRSELLFSKSVILVEGDAEEILVPIITKKVLGISLDEIGVSLINIGSVGFENIYKVFNQSRVRKNCAILSDLDTPLNDSDDSQKHAHELGIARQKEIEEESKLNQYIKGFFCKYTFEVELVPNNINYFYKLVEQTYTDIDVKDSAKKELTDSNPSIYGERALKIAKYNKKGWNALKLSGIVDGKFYIPNYIIDALLYVGKVFLKNVYNIKTMLKNYCINYNDIDLLKELDRNEKNIEVSELVEKAEHQDCQIIKIIKRIIR